MGLGRRGFVLVAALALFTFAPMRPAFAAAPVASDGTATVTEDTPTPITLDASDADGDTLTYMIVQQPAHGQLNCDSAPSCTYTPDLNYNGSDSFTFSANDGTTDSNVATVSITVTPVNDPPVAADATLSVPEDGSAPISLLALDPDLDPLTFSIVDQPAHGAVSCNPPGSNSCTYNATDPNYNGSDSFTFKANDGVLDSNTATITVTVTPVNDPPVATDGTLSVSEDSTAPITLQATDVDGDALTYAVAQPAHGTVSCTPLGSPTCTYAPDAGYSGPDVFTFHANDGQADSNTATIGVTVAAVDHAPVASDDTLTVAEDSSAPITLHATDADGDPLTYAIVGQPGHGNVTCDPGGSPNCTYAPDAGYSGPDSFTFRANDGQLNSNVATVNVTVTPVDDPPVATNGTMTVPEDASGGVTLHATDIDSPTLTYFIVSQPAHGNVVCNPGGSPNCTYTATDQNYNGPDSFTFRANDGQLDSNTATITVTVTPVNDPPVAADGTLSVSEDSTAPLTLPATDVENDPLTYAIVGQPTHGEVVCLAGGSPDCTYVATDPNYNGPDSFTFKANDGQLDSNTATISVTVTPVDDAPVASDGTLSLAEDASAPVSLHATDIDSPTLTYSVVSQPAHGLVTCTPAGSANCTYAANDLNYNGPDSFMFKANDGQLDSNIATVSVTITPVNDPPVAVNRTLTTLEDTPGAITLSATDPENDALTYSITTPPAHGTVTCTPADAPDCTYTPAPNYDGPDSFRYKANDGQLDSNIATVTITVTPVNDAPVAGDGTLTVLEDSSAPVTLLATDIDSPSLTYSIVNQPLHGSVSCTPGNGPACTYTATDLNYNGPDSFTFTANDGQLDSNIATVSVTVAPVNDPPVALDSAISVGSDGVEQFTLAATDVDSPGLTYTIVTRPAHGTVTCAPSGSPTCTFTTTDNHFQGTDSFTFKANDGQLDSNIATVTVGVASTNQPPVVTNRTFSVPEDAGGSITLTGTDPNNDSLTFSVVSQPLHGAVVCDPAGSGSCTFTANDPNYNGPDSFTYRANDGQADSNIGTVAVTITPVDDQPVAADGTLTVAEDGSGTVTLQANDIDSPSLTFIIVTQGAHGNVKCSPSGAPTCTYTATDLNYDGTDSFTFKANDGELDSNIATVGVTITPVNDPPIAGADSVTTLEDTPVTITRAFLLSNDIDVDSPTITFSGIVSPPSNGVLTVVSGGFVYAPNPNYNGTDSFNYRVSDGSLTADGVVTIHITPVNDPPVGNADGPYAVSVNVPLTVNAPGVLGNDTDVDADHLTALLVSPTSHGVLSLHADGSFAYDPQCNNFRGNDSFTYQAVDPTNAKSNIVTVSLKVGFGTDAPFYCGTTSADDIGFTQTLSQGLSVDLRGGNDVYRFFFGGLLGPVNVHDSGNDTGDRLIVSGTGGNDTINVAGNQVTWGAQKITYSGIERLDVLAGNGNDTINVDARALSAGVRTFDGGAGTDTLSINAGGLDARISGNTLYISGRAAFTWSGFERILLTSGVGAQQIDGTGYWIFATSGGVYAFGDARNYGSTAGMRLKARIIQMIPTPSGRGYWMLASDGGVFSFGDARFYGSTGALRLKAPIIQMIPTPSGRGYWLLARDGGVFSFGNARFYGSTGAMTLRSPIMQMVATATGRGYWLHAADGGIFAFGDARFFGSAAGVSRTRPVVALVRTPAGDGYWVLEADGRVSGFGSVARLGRSTRLPTGVTARALISTPTGRGYWIVASDGSVAVAGDAPFLGSMVGKRLPAPIVGMAATPTGRGYWLVAGDGSLYSFGDARFYGSARAAAAALFTPGGS